MQKNVKRFIEKYNLNNNSEVRYIDLVSEVGELGKEILKGNDYGKKAFLNSENIENEIGDCLFSLLALCCNLNINADKALENVLNKYTSRFVKNGDISSYD